MNLKQLREQAKLTQTEFAKKIGVTQACVAMWETGKSIPKSNILTNIAQVLNCTIDEILGEEVETMNLKKLREARNLTQAELAEMLGMSQQGYASYENGRTQPNPETLKKCAEIFNCTTDCLLGLENPPKNTFYDIFVNLCEQKRIKPSRVALEAGFNKSSITNWKKKGYVPTQNILLKLANYFNVPTDCLLGLENPPILNRLKIEREKRGLTQEEVSSFLGYKSKSSYCQIESGLTKPDPETLLKLAEIYNTSVDYLLGVENENINHNDNKNKDIINALHDFIIRVSNGNFGDYGPTESETQILPDIIKLWIELKERN